MSDFHASLDRALAGHETPNGNTYWFDEAYRFDGPTPNPFVDAFPGDWKDVGFTDLTDLKPMQDKVNADIERLSESVLRGAVSRPSHPMYDIRWRDPRPVTREVVINDLGTIAEIMADCERPYQEAARRYERIWLQAWIAATKPDWRSPLCEQEIPAEGVE